MEASLIRLADNRIDIKILQKDSMHILQWRRLMFRDEVLLDGKRQQVSWGLWGRETIYGLVFGRDDDGDNGQRIMLIVDPNGDMGSASYWLAGENVPSGVRLENSEGPMVAYGTLDERAYDRPADFGEWVKKHMGLRW